MRLGMKWSACLWYSMLWRIRNNFWFNTMIFKADQEVKDLLILSLIEKNVFFNWKNKIGIFRWTSRGICRRIVYVSAMLLLFPRLHYFFNLILEKKKWFYFLLDRWKHRLSDAQRNRRLLHILNRTIDNRLE